MKLTEFTSVMHDINVEITDFINEQTIYCGNINRVKFTLNTFKDNTFNKYDVVAVFSSCEENCNMQIYVVEDRMIKSNMRNYVKHKI